MKILNKRPDLADDDFYLQPNPSWLKYGIWYRTTHKYMKNYLERSQSPIDILMSDLVGQKKKSESFKDITKMSSQQDIENYCLLLMKKFLNK
ncbi:1832_t:CDS:2 [Rhizophagus irregularis]|nr:1832_t:CDS:2 [Rhizophagus irregularis]